MSTASRGPLATLVLFGLTLFASAALLFSVEPLVGKLVLPVLGGAPAVWNTCLVFFQAVLLAGYLYAHALSRTSRATQLVVHAVVLLLPFAVLPLGRPPSAPGASGAPVPWLATHLLIWVGPPFFALSTCAPLLQRWFASSGHRLGKDPYFLYAASNAGSFVGLLSYPFVIEPWWGLRAQGLGWTFAYATLLPLAGACAWVGAARVQAPSDPLATGHTLTTRDRAWWLVLSALPSSLLLGVTTHLTTDVAPMPLLWVAPLALYLVAFAVAFAVAPHTLRVWVPPVAAAAVFLLIAQVSSQQVWSLPASLLVHLTTFTAVCLFCLADLNARRPDPAHLTEFYVWMAAGGVIGGLFNALVAPSAFDAVWEYPLAMVVFCGLLPYLRAVVPGAATGEVRSAVVAGTVVSGTLLLFVARPAGTAWLGATAVLVSGLVALAWLRPRWAGALAATVFVLATVLAGRVTTALTTERSFFGVHRVTASATPPQHALMHGTTLHGTQWLGEGADREPRTYFHRQGPLGDVFSAAQAQAAAMQVGVIGLGSGSIAAYARPSDRFTFFEIDPVVETLARNTNYFTFLSACGARCAVALGDARLTLGQAHGPFDLLVLDAFSSDAIPAHLLTREAVMRYAALLSPGGAIAFHISNRHLRLLPVVTAVTRSLGLEGRTRFDTSGPGDSAIGKTASQWVVAAPPGAPVLAAFDARWTPLSAVTPGPLWTDDYSSLVGIFGGSQ